MGTLLRDKFGPYWRMGWYRRSKNVTFGQNQNRGYPAIFAQKKNEVWRKRAHYKYILACQITLHYMRKFIVRVHTKRKSTERALHSQFPLFCEGRKIP